MEAISCETDAILDRFFFVVLIVFEFVLFILWFVLVRYIHIAKRHYREIRRKFMHRWIPKNFDFSESYHFNKSHYMIWPFYDVRHAVKIASSLSISLSLSPSIRRNFFSRFVSLVCAQSFVHKWHIGHDIQGHLIKFQRKMVIHGNVLAVKCSAKQIDGRTRMKRNHFSLEFHIYRNPKKKTNRMTVVCVCHWNMW